jgi:hypothetical protein
MGRVHVVVDGSNIATEGRTAPSLAQLDEAVRSFIAQYGYEKVTVIVDATFGHRIDESDVPAFEEAILAGELVTPPAGTIGRGDAFILQVARLADADVLSNDSFQELHAEHPWLFEGGRLWGGKPVPAVGWVFVGRAPVRGLTSRRAVQAAKRASKAADTATKRASQAKTAADAATVAAVEAVVASEDAVAPSTTTRRRRRRTGTTGESAREPANPKLAYAAFVVEHPIGSIVHGTVERFSSHGAYVRIDGAAGYVPLRSLGSPAPRSAREILSLGEERAFVVARFEPTTRGIDVVPADLDATPTSAPSRAKAATASAAAVSSETDAEEAPVSPAAKKTAAKKKATAKRAPARKTAAKKKATAKRAPARKKATTKRAPARKTAAKKKATSKRAPARKTAKKKATAKRAPARKTAKKKTAARKSAAKKR